MRKSQQLFCWAQNSISHLRLWCSAGWLIAILQLSDSRSFKSVDSPPLSTRQIPIKQLASLSALWSPQMKLLCGMEQQARWEERELDYTMSWQRRGATRYTIICSGSNFSTEIAEVALTAGGSIISAHRMLWIASQGKSRFKTPLRVWQSCTNLCDKLFFAHIARDFWPTWHPISF